LHTSIIGETWAAAALPRPLSRDQLELDALTKYLRLEGKVMAHGSVLDSLRQFTQLVERALEQGQEVHVDYHLGNYDEPGEDGYARPRLDGSAALMVFIDPLPPSRHR